MAVTHNSTARNLMADQVTALLDAGATFGRLLMKDSGSTTVVNMQMGSSAFGVATSGICTAETIVDSTALLAATVVEGVLSASCSTEHILFLISSTGGAGDLQLSSNILSSGQTVSITSLTYTASV